MTHGMLKVFVTSLHACGGGINHDPYVLIFLYKV